MKPGDPVICYDPPSFAHKPLGPRYFPGRLVVELESCWKVQQLSPDQYGTYHPGLWTVDKNFIEAEDVQARLI